MESKEAVAKAIASRQQRIAEDPKTAAELQAKFDAEKPIRVVRIDEPVGQGRVSPELPQAESGSSPRGPFPEAA